MSDELLGRCGRPVRFEAAGGVEVARRLRDGERADVIVLAAEALAALDGDGLLVPATVTPLFRSEVVAAVPAGAVPPPLEVESDLRAALTRAGRIAYSTGPSGTALVELVQRWGLLDDLGPRLVQAPAGTPVASLLAGGDADLGFQQRSELSGAAGVRVLGPLPGTAAIRSTFSGAVLTSSDDADGAREVIAFLASPGIDDQLAAAGLARPTPPERRSAAS